MNRRAINVEKLLAALRIDYRKRGKEFFAPCPSGTHDDAHASWRMRSDPRSWKHGYHHCFSCKFGGGPADLVMHLRKYRARAVAWEWIEKLFVEGATEMAPPDLLNWHLDYGRLFKIPDDVDFGPIETWVGPARSYALKRGITPDQVERWGIGNAVTGKLANRIVFPTRDYDGVARNYTARTYLSTEEKRYYASPAYENPDIGSMFGMQTWPEELGEREVVCVFEGAINGLAIERAAPNLPLAGLSGSDLHLEHACHLSSFKYRLIATDPDKSGNKAAQRILDLGPGERVILPSGEDAASLDVETLKRCLGEHATRM